MKKVILISLFLMSVLNAFAQNPKVKIVLYPCDDFEYQKALSIANDTTYGKEVCIEIVRKCIDPTYPVFEYPPTKVDYYSYKGDVLLGVCAGHILPSTDVVKNYGEYAMVLLQDPKFAELINKKEKNLN